MTEINRLTWGDVFVEDRYIILFTRKKRGGHRTPRKIPMTQKLYEIMQRRFSTRNEATPYVFWHEYNSSGKIGPYLDRKHMMRTLCRRAGVKYFRYHTLRHLGASLMAQSGVPIRTIQEILGHEKMSTTEIYLHNITGAEINAIETLEENYQHTESHTKGVNHLKLVP